MTNKQINIAIADACGWSNDDIERGYTLCQFSENVPDYCNDLNAMHEAEKVLTDEQDLDYSEMLESVVKARWGANNACDMQRFRSATSRQRAEAFLKTIGKWEGGPQ